MNYSSNQITENKISSTKFLIFYLQIRLPNFKTLVVTCPVVSPFDRTGEKMQNFIFQAQYSLIMFQNAFISCSEKLNCMAGEELNENTQRILQFIQEHPGSHLRWILKDLNLSMGTTQYHLELLEKMGKIVSEKDSFQRFYFPVGSFGNMEKNIMKILNQDTARDILLLVIEKKNPTQTDIVNSIKISPATANWHITRLVEFGIIQEQRDGKFKRYSLNGNANNIVNILKNYHSSIWNTWSSRMAELFIASSPMETRPQ